jgi:hypothetical protein
MCKLEFERALIRTGNKCHTCKEDITPEELISTVEIIGVNPEWTNEPYSLGSPIDNQKVQLATGDELDRQQEILDQCQEETRRRKSHRATQMKAAHEESKGTMEGERLRQLQAERRHLNNPTNRLDNK